MADARKRIWVTRSSPGAEATAARLTAGGLTPVIAPLLEVRPVADARLDLTDVRAIAFTSANGVRAFAERSPERGFKVFAVGAATAEAARMARFSTVLSTDGDVSALARALVSRKRELTGGVILHPGAAEPAGDLAGELEAQGLVVRAVPLYETVLAALPDGFTQTLADFAAVLVHSPKGAGALKDLLKAHPTPSLKVFGLSKAVIRPLQRTELAERAAAPEPKDEALITLLQRRLAAGAA